MRRRPPPTVTPLPVMIQIDSPISRLTIQDAVRKLAIVGLEIDVGYGPYLIDPAIGRYVVRGVATKDAIALARDIPGVQIFVDNEIDAAGV